MGWSFNHLRESSAFETISANLVLYSEEIGQPQTRSVNLLIVHILLINQQ